MDESHTATEYGQVKRTTPLKRRILLGAGLPLWVLSGFIVAGSLLGVVIGILIDTDILGPGQVNESVFNSLVAALVFTLTLVIVVGVPYKILKNRTTKEEIGLTRLPSWTDIWLAPIAFLGYLIITAILTAVVAVLAPGIDLEQAQETGFENISQSYEYILAFITLVIIAPVAEEVLVRGYLYGKMRVVTGVVVAAIVSSLLFSLMHFQWNVALNVLPLGIATVILREMTGSIWAGILLHMLKNGVAYYFLFVNPSIFDTIG